MMMLTPSSTTCSSSTIMTRRRRRKQTQQQESCVSLFVGCCSLLLLLTAPGGAAALVSNRQHQSTPTRFTPVTTTTISVSSSIGQSHQPGGYQTSPLFTPSRNAATTTTRWNSLFQDQEYYTNSRRQRFRYKLRQVMTRHARRVAAARNNQSLSQPKERRLNTVAATLSQWLQVAWKESRKNHQRFLAMAALWMAIATTSLGGGTSSTSIDTSPPVALPIQQQQQQLMASSSSSTSTSTPTTTTSSMSQQTSARVAATASQSPSVKSLLVGGDHDPMRGGASAVRAKKEDILSRGGKQARTAVGKGVSSAAESTSRTFVDALNDLGGYMKGPKSDTLLLLLATALITPLCKRLGTSPILGFLASGMMLGPNGWGLISGIHTTETLAELGIVFFLFEMGIELSFERLLSMKRDVFGLGLCQFVASALAIAGVGSLFGLPGNALVVLGGGLSLSSSAFVLQLLKDKNQLATRFGKASFGVLLFQDLAVVPLLVVTPILAGGGGGLASALGSALLKAGIALGSITMAGRYVVNPMFKLVAQAKSQEAFLGVILLTVLSMSFMTEGLGLSNTLGAFLAGVLLSETKYRYQVEADIAPFRGILLGLFFVTVGFEIDLGLIASNIPMVSSVVVGILAIKSLILTALSRAFGLSLSVSQQTGLILSQGGEFAFVAFGLARSLGILDKPTTKFLLTCVSLTMALTPAMASVGARVTKQLEEKSDFTHYLGQDRDANEISESEDFAVVVGYGAVGKVVCDLLDRKLVKYVGIDIDPNKAIQARNAGLPVFYGDIGRQEVADAFNVGKAKAIIVCISDQDQATRAVIALRRWYPEMKIFSRAKDKDHAFRLQSTLDVAAMVPILPEDNLLLTLPFGGAVLKALGAPPEEVNAILETKRKEVMSGLSLVENEEDMALVQLGIEPESKKITSNTDGTITIEMVDEEDDLVNAAKERVEETKEKSPMVAQLLGEVCPDIALDEETKKVDVVANSTEDEEVVVESVMVDDAEAMAAVGAKVVAVTTNDEDNPVITVDAVTPDPGTSAGSSADDDVTA